MSDNYHFFHGTLETEDFKKFFREGAKSVGKGWFGQEKGFYVWPTKPQAADYVIFRDSKYEVSFSRGMIIEVSVPKEQLRYPLWQLDLESTSILQPLLGNDRFLNRSFSVQDEWHGSYDLTLIKNGQNEKVLHSEKLQKDISLDTHRYPENISFIQALNHLLCQNDTQYVMEYNQLLERAISEKSEALKYTGEKPLQIESASYVKIKENDKGQLYCDITDIYHRQNKEQICPFLKMNFIQKRMD